MKTLLLTLALGLLALPLQSIRAMTLDQLEKGAIALVASDPEGVAPSEKMAVDGMLFMGYYWGFFQSIQNETWRLPEGARESSLQQPRKWMYDLSKGSASLLSFLRSYKPADQSKRTTIPAGPVMTAWMLWNAEENEGRNKWMALEILKGQYGEQFDGRDEMINQLASTMTKEALLRNREEKTPTRR